MWSPTLLFDRRAYGPEKLSSVTQEDFCNTICQQATSRDLIDHLVGERQQGRGHGYAERFGGLDIDL
jgi:hypothetical protein